ncbi:MAG TPA: chemotaxis protein CheW [Blastocatellia bacterium]|nr:chemotaxis protein CheW [Blastocatellia bacterium]
MSEQKSGIDWNIIHQRLRLAEQALAEQSAALTPEEQHGILRTRAQKLARAPLQQTAEETQLEVIEFRMAGERCAIETAWVREVWPLRELTPVPCTPPFVRGVINVRGRIVSVIEPGRFFGLQSGGLTDLNKAIILHSPQMEFGLLADEIIGVRAVPVNALQPELPTLTGLRADYLRGVTGDGLVILAADRLLSDPNLIVREEVTP